MAEFFILGQRSNKTDNCAGIGSVGLADIQQIGPLISVKM
jgi:hypothetical protein